MTSSPLSPLAENELASALGRLRQDGRAATSWGALMSSWRTFVGLVERGYHDSIYEYTNDLSARDRLEAVLDELSYGVRALIEPALVIVDAEFVDATDPSSVAIPGGAGTGWWWWRIPAKLGDELLADLRAERLLEGPDGNGPR